MPFFAASLSGKKDNKLHNGRRGLTVRQWQKKNPRFRTYNVYNFGKTIDPKFNFWPNFIGRQMEEIFSELQATLIRERLIFLYSAQFNRTSVRDLLTDIVYSDATSYDEDCLDNDSIEEGDEYDKFSTLKNDTLQNFLCRKTRRPRNEFLHEIFLYLKENKWINDGEIDMLANNDVSKFPFSVCAKSDRNQAPLIIPGGDFFFDKKSDNFHEVQSLLTARVIRQNHMVSRRRVIIFERKESEIADAFYLRCRQGSGETDLTYNGLIFSLSLSTALILETADGDTFPTSQVQNKGDGDAIYLRDPHNGEIKAYNSFEKLSNKLQKHMYLRIIKSNGNFLFSNIDKKINKQNYFKDYIMLENDNNLLKYAQDDDVNGIIRALLNGADINAFDSNSGYTAMHWVAHNCSDEAFAVLTMRPEEYEFIRNVFLRDLSKEFGDIDAMMDQLCEIASQRDALLKDSDGYLPSGRIGALNISRSDPENLAKKAFWDRLMSVEFKAAQERGQSFFDIVGTGGQPHFPNLEFDN
ncbi:hypothetical protein [Thalassospira alkalitolerans]|uniref:Ankyrin n=1 Tax=Thalassospira alkalitolerans TaxID=1293890 RepID=A0A1Y2LB42_9PROT|nr:hypothetical protein [Thalassospira alkalitolerans]OSQ47041.1 hypothetical protein TALK_13500 [Thalassospira alkalitolerans]